MLRADNVSYAVGRSGRGNPLGPDAGMAFPILQHVDVHIRPGTFVGVIGPNGAGKTTLMRVLAGIVNPTGGEVCFEGRSVHHLSERERALSMAFMSQNPGIGFGFTVEDVVAMGRYAHRKPWALVAGRKGRGRGGWSDWADRGSRGERVGWSARGDGDDRSGRRGGDRANDGGNIRGRGRASDRQAIEEAMAATEITHLRHRTVTHLSGGERQRVFLARTLAQQPRLLFLDEPTSDLDIRFQLDILNLVTRLRAEHSLTVVMAIHDLTWALRYCDEILALQAGRVAAFGPAPDVLTEGLIGDVFGVEARVEQGADGAPRVDFVGSFGGHGGRATG